MPEGLLEPALPEAGGLALAGPSPLDVLLLQQVQQQMDREMLQLAQRHLGQQQQHEGQQVQALLTAQRSRAAVSHNTSTLFVYANATPCSGLVTRQWPEASRGGSDRPIRCACRICVRSGSRGCSWRLRCRPPRRWSGSCCSSS
jgi:hypothetical protein